MVLPCRSKTARPAFSSVPITMLRALSVAWTQIAGSSASASGSPKNGSVSSVGSTTDDSPAPAAPARRGDPRARAVRAVRAAAVWLASVRKRVGADNDELVVVGQARVPAEAEGDVVVVDDDQPLAVERQDVLDRHERKRQLFLSGRLRRPEPIRPRP